MADAEEPASQRLLEMTEWEQASFPAACDKRGEIYLPVRSLCKYFGISSQMQTIQLQKSHSLSKYLRQFYITGRGGRQASWCLNLRAVAFWIAALSIDRVRPELQQGILEWQDVLIHAAHSLFFGDYTDEQPMDAQEMAQRLKVAEMEIRRLKMLTRVQGRRLATLERHSLPANVYYDLEGDDED